MSAQPIPKKMSEEHLAFEHAGEFKHEYVNGEIIEETLAFSEVYKKVSFPKET
jgi:hypothetical protein